MKEIKLTQGLKALVDDEDFEYLSQFNWFAKKVKRTFYANRNLRHSPTSRTTKYMHNFILDAGSDQIDHIDGNGLNNQKSNLRVVNHRQNCQNLHIKKSSKFPGVTWNKRLSKWQAQIKIDGKNKYLGLFSDEVLAYQRYLSEVPA